MDRLFLYKFPGGEINDLIQFHHHSFNHRPPAFSGWGYWTSLMLKSIFGMLSKHHFVPPSSSPLNFSIIANIFIEWRDWGWRRVLFIAFWVTFLMKTPHVSLHHRSRSRSPGVGRRRRGVTRHRTQWPGPSRRKYLSLLRQKIFGAKKNMFTEFGRQQQTLSGRDGVFG